MLIKARSGADTISDMSQAQFSLSSGVGRAEQSQNVCLASYISPRYYLSWTNFAHPMCKITFHGKWDDKMAINQLVYLSQAVRKMSQNDLSAIQQTAKGNNGPLDVTGSLFYNGGWFLQVLEGPASVLEKLYKKIELDPRHKNSRILYNEPATFRTFPRWNMNMTNLDDRQADKYEELVAVLEAAQAGRKIGSVSPAVALLKIFKS